MQILNIHDTHWIYVTNVGSKPNEVKVYDSMCTGDIPMNTKEVIASLIRLSQTYIFLTFPDVQQQVGSSDCGLYSLAFAYALSSGKDPAKLEYNQVQFREHYLECLKKGDISPFPHDAVMKNPKKPSFRKFAVYCLTPGIVWYNVSSVMSGSTSPALDWTKVPPYPKNGTAQFAPTSKSSKYLI